MNYLLISESSETAELLLTHGTFLTIDKDKKKDKNKEKDKKQRQRHWKRFSDLVTQLTVPDKLRNSYIEG